MKTKQHYQLIRRYHTICNVLGLDEERRKEMLLLNFGVESSKELSITQLIEMCDRLNRETNVKGYDELDKLRKRVIACIGKWLKEQGVPGDIEYIKAIACRSACNDRFNRISKERLNNIYYAFKNKVQDAEQAKLVQAELLVMTSRMN